MFNGVSTEIFKLELNQFKYIPKFSLTHITNGALKTMMKQFIDLANMIQHLNLFVLNCCHNSKFGNTLSRLGMIVHTLLLDFQNHIHQLQLILSNRADIEKYSCQSLTLLSLMNHFNVLLSDLVYMHDFLNSMVSFHWIEFKYRDGVKSNTVIVNDILMGFYNRIIQYPDTDMKSKSLVLKWFFYCLEPTLVIISRLISTGVLKDVHQEFFIQCGTDTDGSPLDWKTCGVLLKESCPIFFIPVSEALMNIYKCGLLIGIKYNETIHLESDVSIYLEKHEKGDDDEGIEVVDTIRDIEKKENISELTFESWMITPEPISFKTVQKDHLEFKNIHHFETFLEKLIHKLIQPYNLYFNQQLSNYLIKQHQIQNHIQQIQNLFLFLHPQLTHDIILLTKTKSNCKPFQLQQFFESTFRKQNIWDYYKSIDFRIIPNDQFKSNSKLITPFDVITIQLNVTISSIPN
ncbi:gamma-tubulin complex component protein [Globomyces pollinis-pini]|nr:gamma-tubulin complex component protein [Globomyces pollinis-pini]